jgi:eukaryotic-like serine/threonine-protein kinase
VTLTPDAKLGPYEMVTQIGAGGMGEVYRARDARLGRDVALKVLPAEFVTDAERLARFSREAQVLASLNHPNIAAIYGFEDSGSVHALVMELVEGPTLAERIAKGPIPLDETLAIAKQICEALEYAHERGIVHRDLKPSNIKLTNNDAVKILDFGLAKALESDRTTMDISSSPTISRMATQAGIILGTAAYMSPEQAKAKALDRRTDIWSFGCVLYEILTAKIAFSGETVTDTLAAVIKSEPNWGLLPKDTPAHVRGLLRRCLKKDMKQRLQSIGDARIAIDEILTGAAAAVEGQTFTAVKALPRAWLPWTVAALCALTAAGLAAYLYIGSRMQSATGNTMLDVSLPDGVSVVTKDALNVALSPDGRRIVFVGTKGDVPQLYSRALDEPDAELLEGTNNGVSPFFSPDGKWIGFFADGKLKKIPADGGTAQILCDAPNQRGGTWTNNGTIIFSPEHSGGLMQVPESGGQPQQIILPNEVKGERTYRWPDALPNAEGVIFTIGMENSAASYDDAEIAVYSPATRRTRVLTHGDMAVYSPAGYLLYYRAGALFAVPFDPKRIAIKGEAAQLPEEVGDDPTSGATYFAIASNGTMTYLRGSTDSTGRLVTIADANGNGHVLPLAPRGYSIPRFSPDCKRLVLAVNNHDNGIFTGQGDLWLYDFGAGSLSRLTFDDSSDYALWSPDGSTIFFDSSRGQGSGNLYAKSANGTGGARPVLTNQLSPVSPDAFSRDGKTIVFTREGGPGGDLWTLNLGPGSKPKLFKANAEGAAISRDGNYIAYTSYQSGTYQVFASTFPDPTKGEWQISQERGAYPKWCKEGREIVFYDEQANRMMAADVSLKPSFRASSPRPLFTLSRAEFGAMQTNPASDYDASSDCQRFVFLQSSGGANQPSAALSVTLNLPAQIRGLTQK